MVSPISAATQGLISSGSHFPLVVGIQGLLIFVVTPGTQTRQRGDDTAGMEEEERGGSRHRHRRQEEEQEILAIINAFLRTQ